MNELESCYKCKYYSGSMQCLRHAPVWVTEEDGNQRAMWPILADHEAYGCGDFESSERYRRANENISFAKMQAITKVAEEWDEICYDGLQRNTLPTSTINALNALLAEIKGVWVGEWMETKETPK